MPNIPGFLEKIAQIESSGGKNTNHPMVTHGVNKGNFAIGKYGLMPNTINEVVNRARRDGVATPELLQLQNAAPEDIQKAFNENPDIENQVAQHYANTLNKMKNGDEQRMAYSWNNGEHSNPPMEQVSSHPYVQKYNALAASPQPQRSTASAEPLPTNYPSLIDTSDQTTVADGGLNQVYQKFQNLKKLLGNQDN